MTDKQIIVLRKVIALLKADSTFKFVGWFPDDLNKGGQNYPYLLIRDGNEDVTTSSGSRTDTLMIIEVWLYTNINVNRIDAVLTIQNKISTILLKNQSLYNTCVQIEPVFIDKGGDSEDIDLRAPGYYYPVTVRRLDFTVQIYDER
jgi:hypothetical protein